MIGFELNRMNNVILLRHGKVDSQPGLFGRTDVNVESQVQQHILTQWIEANIDLDGIITSPLNRCAELAYMIGKHRQLPIDVMPNLQEMDFGDLDGLTFDQMTQQQWQLMEQFWHSPAEVPLPNAETLTQFHRRVISAWQHIGQRQGNHLILAHGGVIRMIIAHILGLDWQQPQLYANLHIDNASATHIQIYPQAQQFTRLKAIGTSLQGISL